MSLFEPRTVETFSMTRTWQYLITFGSTIYSQSHIIKEWPAQSTGFQIQFAEAHESICPKATRQKQDKLCLTKSFAWPSLPITPHYCIQGDPYGAQMAGYCLHHTNMLQNASLRLSINQDLLALNLGRLFQGLPDHAESRCCHRQMLWST